MKRVNGEKVLYDVFCHLLGIHGAPPGTQPVVFSVIQHLAFCESGGAVTPTLCRFCKRAGDIECPHPHEEGVNSCHKYVCDGRKVDHVPLQTFKKVLHILIEEAHTPPSTHL